MEEAKPRPKENTDKELAIMLPENKPPEIGSIEKTTTEEVVTNSNVCSNVIKDCVTVIVRKRSGNRRKIVYLILIIVFLSQALDLEYVNEYYFVRRKLNWEALDEAPYAAYGSATFFIGTTFMIAVVSKYFKMSDTMIVLISILFTTVSKIVFITVTTTLMLYVAKTLDMFVGLRSLVVRRIISAVVESTEIGKIYSVMGVLENFSKFIFVSIYTIIYKYTVDTLPNAYFICSLAIIIVVTILCWILHRWVKRSLKIASNELTDSQ